MPPNSPPKNVMFAVPQQSDSDEYRPKIPTAPKPPKPQMASPQRQVAATPPVELAPVDATPETPTKSKAVKTSLFSNGPQRPVVGEVKKFEHVTHLEFSEAEGFLTIPVEWKELFEKAGVKESELRDPKTAKYILKVIAKSM